MVGNLAVPMAALKAVPMEFLKAGRMAHPMAVMMVGLSAGSTEWLLVEKKAEKWVDCLVQMLAVCLAVKSVKMKVDLMDERWVDWTVLMSAAMKAPSSADGLVDSTVDSKVDWSVE